MSVMDFWQTCVHFLSNLPNKLGVDRAKQSDPWSIHFWYRQVFHALGGGIVAGITCFSLYAQWITYGILSAYIAWREAEDAKNGQPIFKTIVDFLMWTTAFMTMMYLTNS